MSLRKELFRLLTEKVPPGRVTTYGDLARALNTRAYRAIGAILKSNPNIPTIPCHRVVKSNGSIGGYVHGTEAKIKRLEGEGVIIRDNKLVNFQGIRVTDFNI
jgi:methylated-DNA-[protein]-cysteine S-methyltransferase